MCLGPTIMLMKVKMFLSFPNLTMNNESSLIHQTSVAPLFLYLHCGTPPPPPPQNPLCYYRDIRNQIHFHTQPSTRSIISPQSTRHKNSLDSRWLVYRRGIFVLLPLIFCCVHHRLLVQLVHRFALIRCWKLLFNWLCMQIRMKICFPIQLSRS